MALSDTDYARLRSDLAQPKTRLEAISRLYAYEAANLWGGSSAPPPPGDTIHRRAIEIQSLLTRYETPETVRAALAATRDVALARWGMGAWTDLRTGQGSDPAVWRSMLPLVEKLAESPDPAIRQFAVGTLGVIPDESQFMREWASRETDPTILKRLTYDPDPAAFSRAYDAQLMRLLRSRDDSVVCAALESIAYNGLSPDKAAFDDAVVAQVAALARARKRRVRDLALVAEGALIASTGRFIPLDGP